MAEEIVTTRFLLDYLGADSEKEEEVEALRASAIETLCRAAGIGRVRRDMLEAFNEAVRVQVYLSYYAVRDATKNTQFLQEYLTRIICSLQLCGGE